MSLDGVRAAYDASAPGWESGPAAVYARLAAVMLACAPVPIVDARVLDIGAGTAVASREALALGAGFVVATDVSTGMLSRRGPHLPAVVADACRLPFAAGSFDLVTAACCLGHLRDPARALSEARRVGTGVVASAFRLGWTHPAKSVIDETMGSFGFRPPAWYVRLKSEVEPRVDDPAALSDLAEVAGFADVRVTEVAVPTGLRTAAQLVGWRLGMAHLAPFVATLPPQLLAEARRSCEAAVGGAPPLVVPLVVLSAR